MRVPWRVPVMQAPIGPATTPELVSAVTGTGALGTLAASWTKPDTLRRQLRAIQAAAGVDYCVNLVLAFDQEERLEVVLEEGARHVSFSWGIDSALIGRARDRGAVVLVQVGDVASAVEAVERGAEVVIAQGVEAGGHVQGRTPVLELVSKMRSVLELPISVLARIIGSFWRGHPAPFPSRVAVHSWGPTPTASLAIHDITRFGAVRVRVGFLVRG